MTNAELTDLGNLAIDRCRQQLRRVLQLIEDDDESAAILIAVSVDILAGATALLEQKDGRSHHDAIEIALNNFARQIRIHPNFAADAIEVEKQHHGTR